MNQDCCNTGGSLFGSNCSWIIILIIIFILFTCFCNNNNKNDNNDCFCANDIF